jgi:hypothetical protein
MNPKFKKLALAASIGATIGATTMPAQALLIGEAGEALLIPWVTHDLGVANQGKKNTYISVFVPQNVGFDSVPAIYTAPNATPTSDALSITEVEPTIDPDNFIHWFWFNYRSVHLENAPIKITPNQLVWIDWEAVRPGRAGQDGYMVIGNESARNNTAATFAMYGEAWVEIYDEPNREYGSMVPIPVLPMIDGDEPFGSPASVFDNVIYGGGIPTAVSPLYSGVRMGIADGVLGNYLTAFNLSLGDRNFPSWHVMWFDTNLDDVPGYNDYNNTVQYNVYDSQENVCSGSIPVEDELTVVRINPLPGRPGATYVGEDYCEPVINGYTNFRVRHDGIVTYQVAEYKDAGTGLPEAAGISFAVLTDFDSEANLRFTSAPVQVRGVYTFN